ncbi:MAG: aspartate/glutamate racemase family protein, partial [Alcaligenaceae bacterium]|nr:aspartate/glutamate racemase family protein [Alcaligenaceae bacterium]
TLPFVGVEPGVKPAVQASATGVVGVLATAATLRSTRFQTLLDQQAHEIRFVCQAGHGLVELIEHGGVNGPDMDALLRRYLTPMVEQGADTIVLGCTHYALLSPGIRRLFGNDLTLVETGRAVARRVDHQLGELGLRAAPHSNASIRYASTAAAEADRTPLQQLAGQISPESAQVEAAQIDTPMGEPA